MKTLKTFLFLGFIALFTSTAFAQDPHPSKFQLQTEHAEVRYEDNGNASLKKASFQNQSSQTPFHDSDGSRFNIKDNWMDYYREIILNGPF